MNKAQQVVWVGSVVTGLLFAGCKSGVPEGANTPNETHRQQEEHGVAPLPNGFDLFGKECPTVTPPSGEPQPSCGQNDRVVAVGRWYAWSHWPMPKPVLSREAMSSSTSLTHKVLIHVDRKHLWIRTECLVCRTQSANLWIGDLSLVTDEQIGEQQAMIGMPKKPALRDEKSWQAALKKLQIQSKTRGDGK
jgi:hypothetical protein